MQARAGEETPLRAAVPCASQWVKVGTESRKEGMEQRVQKERMCEIYLRSQIPSPQNPMISTESCGVRMKISNKIGVSTIPLDS